MLAALPLTVSVPLALAVSVAASSCASRVSTIPPLARQQVAASGSPSAEWVARDGRLTLTSGWMGGGRRISARVAVHRMADGRVRFGLISDEGVVLADLLVDGDSVTALALRPEIEPTVGVLAHLVRQTWAAPRDLLVVEGPPAAPSAMERSVRLGQWGTSTRIYGGDPVLLRTVSGGGPDLVIEDYRLEPMGLIAHAVRAEGLGYSVQITITQIGLPAPVPAAAAPAVTAEPSPSTEKSADFF